MFASDFETNDGKGVLATYRGDKNNLTIAELRRYAQTPGWFVNIRLVHLFTADFVDLLGASHRTHYRVDDVSSGIELSEEEAARWKSLYTSTDSLGRDFFQLSGVEIVKRIADAAAAQSLKRNE